MLIQSMIEFRYFYIHFDDSHITDLVTFAQDVAAVTPGAPHPRLLVMLRDPVERLISECV